jgi:hypothetical protein
MTAREDATVNDFVNRRGITVVPGGAFAGARPVNRTAIRPDDGLFSHAAPTTNLDHLQPTSTARPGAAPPGRPALPQPQNPPPAQLPRPAYVNPPQGAPSPQFQTAPHPAAVPQFQAAPHPNPIPQTQSGETPPMRPPPQAMPQSPVRPAEPVQHENRPSQRGSEHERDDKGHDNSRGERQ